MFVDLGDGRSAWARRWADLIFAHVNDLGGLERISEAQLRICRRASAMECELEALEARMSVGEPVDSDQYGRLAGRLCRMFELIGIQRVSKPEDPFKDFYKGFPPEPDDDDEPDEDEPAPGH